MTTSRSMRVLGVDPGLTRCGVGVLAGPASRIALVHHTCVRTDPSSPLEQRLLSVHDALTSLIAEYAPDALAVERVLFSANVRTAMATGQAAGAALLAGARAGLPVFSYTPTEVKLTVAGSGGADKAAVARMVAAQLGLGAPPRPADVADALAVAITHLARSASRSLGAATGPAETVADAERDARAAGARGWQGVLADRMGAPASRAVGR